MRLRELEFPIAILQTHSLMGGKAGGLSSVRRFNFNLESFYRRGGFADAVIFDSTGKECAVEAIIFDRPSLWSYVGERLGYLLILPNRKKEPMVRIDMELNPLQTLTIEEMKDRFLRVALKNPTWWQRHASQGEIETMFVDCNSIREVINAIGVLDPPGRERLGNKKVPIIDNR